MIDLETGLRPFSVGVLSAIAFSIGSCGNSSDPLQTDVSGAATDELQVVTTFLPITQFTKAVAGDRAEVEQLIPANAGPHDYQATPEDVQTLANADVLVKNGLEMEEFLEDLVANAGNSDLQTIDSSEGIAIISDEEVEGHEQAEGEEHAEAEHHHHGSNPHIWLDPKRAVKQVENIRDRLIEVDSEGEAEYRANAAAYIKQLQELDAEIASMLQPYAGKTFVAFHDVAPYFAQSYNLEAEFLVEIPEENPSPADVKQVTDAVEESNLKAILTEPQAGSAFGALAKDLNVTVSTFDPIETGEPEEMEPEYYLTIMRQNAKNLVKAFGSTQSVLSLWTPQPVTVIPQRVGVRF